MIGEAIRRFRLEQGLTLRQLASMVGVTDSYILLLEKDTEDPSVAVLRRLAQALHRPISAFFEENNWEPAIARAADRVICGPSNGVFSWEVLTPGSSDGDDRITMARVTLTPGAVIRSDGMPEQACVYLQHGSVLVRLSGAEYAMQTGDSLYLQPFVPLTVTCQAPIHSAAIVSLSGGRMPSVTVERSAI